MLDHVRSVRIDSLVERADARLLEFRRVAHFYEELGSQSNEGRLELMSYNNALFRFEDEDER